MPQVVVEIEYHNEENVYHTTYDVPKYKRKADEFERQLRDKLKDEGIREVDIKQNPGPGKGFHPFHSVPSWYVSRRREDGREEKKRYPGLGAFEVSLRVLPGSGYKGIDGTTEVWSKVRTHLWPDCDRLAADVVQLLVQAKAEDERVRDLVNRLREESSGQKAMRYKPTEGGHARPPSRYKEWRASTRRRNEPMVFGLTPRIGSARPIDAWGTIDVEKLAQARGDGDELIRRLRNEVKDFEGLTTDYEVPKALRSPSIDGARKLSLGQAGSTAGTAPSSPAPSRPASASLTGPDAPRGRMRPGSAKPTPMRASSAGPPQSAWKEPDATSPAKSSTGGSSAGPPPVPPQWTHGWDGPSTPDPKRPTTMPDSPPAQKEDQRAPEPRTGTDSTPEAEVVAEPQIVEQAKPTPPAPVGPQPQPPTSPAAKGGAADSSREAAAQPEAPPWQEPTPPPPRPSSPAPSQPSKPPSSPEPAQSSKQVDELRQRLLQKYGSTLSVLKIFQDQISSGVNLTEDLSLADFKAKLYNLRVFSAPFAGFPFVLLFDEVCDSSAGEKVAKLGELIRRLEAGWPGPSSAQQAAKDKDAHEEYDEEFDNNFEGDEEYEDDFEDALEQPSKMVVHQPLPKTTPLEQAPKAAAVQKPSPPSPSKPAAVTSPQRPGVTYDDDFEDDDEVEFVRPPQSAAPKPPPKADGGGAGASMATTAAKNDSSDYEDEFEVDTPEEAPEKVIADGQAYDYAEDNCESDSQLSREVEDIESDSGSIRSMD
mmetsp:Transcript_30993/g.68438  ORF Transcript_30993/g.68438 Transcript_30993/m.68438 type:complete len:762 (-) Transcript_30993:138-2423(-)